MEVARLERELEISSLLTLEEKIEIARREFSQENARMSVVTDEEKRQRLRHRLTLLGKLRSLYAPRN